MAFTFSAEQEALRDAVRSFVSATVSEPELRRAIETPEGYDPGSWRRLAGELGVAGLLVPEQYDGSGAGIVEAAITLDELGRALYPGPFLSTILATTALLESGNEALQAKTFPAIASGSTVATVAVAEAAGLWAGPGVQCAATYAGGDWVLRGTKCYVTDAHAADLLIVAARTDSGVALFALDRQAPGVAVTPAAGFDLTRRLGTVELSDAPAEPLGGIADGARQLTHFLRLASVLVSAEAIGGAQATLDMAVDYAKERVQFGRVIGSFQAIKHMCADALLDVESARSAAYYAAWAAADGSAELATVAPLAKAYCSDVFFETAIMNMQVHGGISFTWEHPAHLYYRRAKSAKQLWGSPRSHRDELAAQLGL